MKCPKDGTSLARVDVGAIAIDKCHQCDGIWLDYGELKQLRSSGQQGIEEELEQRYGNSNLVRSAGILLDARVAECLRRPVCAAGLPHSTVVRRADCIPAAAGGRQPGLG